MENNALQHYGVLGMRWGVRKAEKSGKEYTSRRTKKLESKIATAKESSQEWKDIAKSKEAKGKIKAAAKSKAYAEQDIARAKTLEAQKARSKELDALQQRLVKDTSVGKNFIQTAIGSKKSMISRNISELNKLTNTSAGKSFARDLLYGKAGNLAILEAQYVKKGSGK